jgi:ribosomal protein S18 acetylase RimI-like enzyme
MTEIFIREASLADAPVVANFIRLMLEEIASMGGHRITESDEEWKRFEELIEERLNNKDCVYLLAHAAKPTPHSIGVVEAQVVTLSGVFEPKKSLHIRSVYVLDEHRRKGVARALLESVLDWGKESGCVEADLNVLSGNPAFHLYKELGFCESEIKMVRKL